MRRFLLYLLLWLLLTKWIWPLLAVAALIAVPLIMNEPLTSSVPRAGSAIAALAIFYAFFPALWNEWTGWITKDHGTSRLAMSLKKRRMAAKSERTSHIVIALILGVVGTLIWGFGDLLVPKP